MKSSKPGITSNPAVTTPNDVSGRYLIVYGRSEKATTRFQLRIVTDAEWQTVYRGNGWFIVCRDPEPNRRVPWEDGPA